MNDRRRVVFGVHAVQRPPHNRLSQERLFVFAPDALVHCIRQSPARDNRFRALFDKENRHPSVLADRAFFIAGHPRVFQQGVQNLRARRGNLPRSRRGERPLHIRGKVARAPRAKLFCRVNYCLKLDFSHIVTSHERNPARFYQKENKLYTKMKSKKID
ncbi:MAG: hypothetical protein BWY28_02853 [bacterium ADurb.Bin236]|nr:MAG: hypothetical protein BWY28_02853 [bacterium ADurb.Bin236]